MKSCSATFCLDKQFVEITIDGRKMMTIFTLEEIFENGRHHLALIQRQVDSSERHIEIIRYVYENVLEVIMKVGDTVARATFETV